MGKIKTNEGITLISLIITIVIIAILAAVTIGSIKDVNIIGRAQEAADEFEKTQEREEKFLKEYESLLKDTPGAINTNFYGPIRSEDENSEIWIVLTQNTIKVVSVQKDIDQVAGTIIGTSYRTITLEEAISLLPESEKQTYINLAEQLKRDVGEIDSVALVYDPNSKQEIFGGVFINNKNTIFLNEDLGILSSNTTLSINSNSLATLSTSSDSLNILNINPNPSELFKEVFYKSDMDNYKVFVRENIENPNMFEADNVDNVILLDYESGMFAVFEYNEEKSLEFGFVTKCEVLENDEEITVYIDDEPITITEKFKKIDIKDVSLAMYIDESDEKLYKSREYTAGGISDGDDAIILLRKDYDIEKLGFVVQ